MKLNNGDDWTPEPEDIMKWRSLYPAVNVEQELNAMAGWLDANPTRRKTPKGIKRFVNAWLSRAQDKGGSPMAKVKQSAASTRNMSMTDELSHAFIDTPEIRAYLLAKYGQVYLNDGTRITSL